LAPHVGYEIPHSLDEPSAARREVLAENVVRPRRDLDNEAVGALELGRNPQHREQEAQVGSDGCLEQYLPVHQFLDLRVEGVDGPLTFGQHLDHLVVATQEGMSRPGHVLGDHGEQFDDLGFDCLERALKLLSMLGHSQILPGAALALGPHLPAKTRGRGQDEFETTRRETVVDGTLIVSLTRAAEAVASLQYGDVSPYKVRSPSGVRCPHPEAVMRVA